MECAGSYGAALSRYLHGRGITVFEVNQPRQGNPSAPRQERHIDAEAAARAVITGKATMTAKAGEGPVEMLRLFKMAKASAIKSRAQAINQLKAVLVVTDPELRESPAGLSNPKFATRLHRAQRLGLRNDRRRSRPHARSCWPGGSNTLPRRSKISPRGSGTSSRSTIRSSWPATASAPTPPRLF